jgi:hypothetical protein
MNEQEGEKTKPLLSRGFVKKKHKGDENSV